MKFRAWRQWQSSGPSAWRAQQDIAVARSPGDGYAGDVLKTVIAKARAGDLTAAAIILARTWPIPRGRKVQLDLPALNSGADLPDALAAVIAAIGAGVVSPEEGAAVAAVLETQRKAIEATEIEARLRAIEAKMISR